MRVYKYRRFGRLADNQKVWITAKYDSVTTVSVFLGLRKFWEFPFTEPPRGVLWTQGSKEFANRRPKYLLLGYEDTEVDSGRL